MAFPYHRRCAISSFTWPTINELSAGVVSLNGKTGTVTLAAGTNITITPSGNTLTIASTGGSPAGTTNGDIQFKNGSVLGADDANLFFDIALGQLNITAMKLTPQATNWLVINSPLGQASPVLEFKSNGSQVAYVSDQGSGVFAGLMAPGIATDQINAYNNPYIILATSINPVSANVEKLGTTGSEFAEVWTYNLNFITAIDGASTGVLTHIANINTHYISDINGATQFTCGASSMAMNTDLDMNGHTILNSGIGLATVLGVSQDAGANAMSNLGALSGTSGVLPLGAATSDSIKFIAGDDGTTPSNPSTPSGYIRCEDNSNASFWLQKFT